MIDFTHYFLARRDEGQDRITKLNLHSFSTARRFEILYVIEE